MAHCICTVGKDGHFTGPAEEVECADDKDRPSPIVAIVGERLPILVLHDEAGFLFIDGRWGRLKKRSGQSAPDGSELSGTPSQLCATGASRSHASWCVKGAAPVFVPEITASEHCTGCSALARTKSARTHYQIVDGKAGPVPRTPDARRVPY
jgi:hypothetical protein